ncbi:MAG TPA: isochorismatase family cysteine hydrolase [Candidatus Bathyarchaeia archaeon]|nr:isochorismatase family cysteine hydrolase [Candidatus Bathyarchaeia archaeon]
MRKDDYFTNENREKKISEWKEILANYYSSKKRFEFRLERTALMIIDMQEYFLNPISHAYLPAARTIIEPIKKLQKAFMDNGKAIFFTKYGLHSDDEDMSIMTRWWNGSLNVEDPMYAIVHDFDTNEAWTFNKPTYDTFVRTNFSYILSKLKYTSLVITGVTTHLCCESTARSAFNNDIEVYLPIDCMATYTEELHLNSLKAASHGFGIPTTSYELLEIIKNEE